MIWPLLEMDNGKVCAKAITIFPEINNSFDFSKLQNR
jgi:hypothetical protein